MRFPFLLVLLTPVALAAQNPVPAPAPSPLTRTVLQTNPLVTVPGHDAIAVRAELIVGGSSPRHQHPGEEIAYVLEGQLTFELAGKAPVQYGPGDAVFIPANTPHVARNVGKVPVKLLSTYIIASGKPLAIPVP
jgi:quercetin dioxygenase-like cupin family protein